MRGFKLLAIILVSLLFPGWGAAQSDPLISPDTTAQAQWVEAQYANMTQEARVGQLFMPMITSESGKEEGALSKAEKWISEYGIGGLIFSRGTPHAQARLTNALQESSRVPLLIGLDAEWGLAMRLDSTYSFPWNMTLGAIQDTLLIKDIGRQMGDQLRQMGVHLNFAPVVDINTNVKNPIIGKYKHGSFKIYKKESRHIVSKVTDG